MNKLKFSLELRSGESAMCSDFSAKETIYVFSSKFGDVYGDGKAYSNYLSI
jgi:hypothetical protein